MSTSGSSSMDPPQRLLVCAWVVCVVLVAHGANALTSGTALPRAAAILFHDGYAILRQQAMKQILEHRKHQGLTLLLIFVGHSGKLVKSHHYMQIVGTGTLCRHSCWSTHKKYLHNARIPTPHPHPQTNWTLCNAALYV